MSEEQQEQLQQEVVRRYENLSDELKRAMMSVSSAEIIYEVGRKHGLNVEKIGILAEEVGYIMLGMVPPGNFINDLKELLETEENKAKEIAQEINHKIFLPIREEMKRAYGMNFSEEVVSPGQQPVRPAAENVSGQPVTRPIPPAPSRFEGPPILQRPVPPPIPSRPIPEFGSGSRVAIPNLQPTTDNQQPTTYHTPPTTRPVPPPIFSQSKEIPANQPIPLEAISQKPIVPSPPPELPTEKHEAESKKPEVGLPEVEEELKPKLLGSLPKEKPLEARIAEKTPPKYHADPYRESTE